MSCSVHDAVELEDRGVRTVALITEVFMSSARAHAIAFGRPDFTGAVPVRHPIIAMGRQELRERADEALPAIVAALTGTRRADERYT